MNQSNTPAQANEVGFCAWIAFWAQLAVLGLVAVLGAAFASANRAPGDDTCGLLLSLGAIALGFILLKSRFDGGAAYCCAFLLVDDMKNLVAVIVVFTLIGLVGLFTAASFDHGGMHDAGIALFVASTLAVFLNLKHVFDKADRTR